MKINKSGTEEAVPMFENSPDLHNKDNELRTV